METVTSPAAACRTLAEYRVMVLKKPQTQIARQAKTSQPRISSVERGLLPRTWNRDLLLLAYDLVDWPQEFVRMVVNARDMLALQSGERLPLFDYAKTEGRVEKGVFHHGDFLEAQAKDEVKAG